MTETPAKDVRRSYRPCTCTRPIDCQRIALPCGCVQCDVCDGYLEWAHDDSL